MERRIDAPKGEWLTDSQAARFLGLGVDAFRGLVRAGVVPAARKWTHKNARWHWQVIVAVSWLMQSGHLDPTKILPRDEPS